MRALFLLSVPLLSPAAALAYDPVVEEANCQRASELSEQSGLLVLQFWDRLAQRTFGKPFAEITPAEQMRLSQVVKRMEQAKGGTVIPQTPAAVERLQQRCGAYQAWRSEHEQLAIALSNRTADSAYYVWRWGQERILGIGCFCPGYVLGDENSENRCPLTEVSLCHGRGGLPRQPDMNKGCRSVVASDWLSRQLPAMYRALALPEFLETVRGVNTARGNMPPIPDQCMRSSTPMPDLDFPRLAPEAVAGSGAALAAAIGPAARCYAQPEPGLCRQAADQGEGLVAAAARAGNRTCLAYAMVAQSVWTLAANPDYTYLLTDYPEATRLRNDANIALRYLRMNCRKV